MKRIFIIVTLTVYIFASVFVFPVKRAEAALPVAIPAGAGIYALVALAGAAVLYGLGQSGKADDLVRNAQDVWNKANQTVKDAVNSVVQYTVSATLPKVLMMMKNLADDKKQVVSGLAKEVAMRTTADFSRDSYESTAPSSDLTWNVSGSTVKVQTKYPDHQISFDSYWNDFKSLTIPSTASTVLLLFMNSTVYNVSKVRWGSSEIYVDAVRVDGYTLTNYRIGLNNFIDYYVQLNDSGSSTENILAILSAPLAAAGMRLQVAPKSTWDSIVSGHVNGKITESVQQNIDKDLVVVGEAVLEANPDLAPSADGTGYVNKTTGEAVGAGSIALPAPQIVDINGEKVLAVPVGDAWANPYTGEIYDVGAPADDGIDIPILGDIFDFLKSILQALLDVLRGLWDFLKGILQSILDAIISAKDFIASILSSIGVLVLLNPILDAIEQIKENTKPKDEEIPRDRTLNLQPLLASFATLKDKFPFSIPWDLYAMIAFLDVPPEAPKFEINVNKTVTILGEDIPIKYKFEISLSALDFVAQVGRWAMVLVFDIALVLALRRFTPD